MENSPQDLLIGVIGVDCRYCKNVKGSAAESASERNFQISSEKNEEGEGMLRLSLPPTDEFFAAER
jgi:hypothetical protein